eukprot:gene317-356_t
MITIRVVIADDDDDVRDALVEVVGADPRLVVVGTARSGDEAVAVCAATRPDVVLLDVRMPGIDGFEVCRRLKASPATAHVPVIFLSAQHDTDDKVRGFALGGADFIAKPRTL